MDGVTLLAKAHAVGLTVKAVGNRLRIRGPRRAEPVVQELIAHKTTVLMVLMEGAAADWTAQVASNDLPAHWHQAWDERAAIMEFDCGLPREPAEALALRDVLRLMAQQQLLG